MTGTLWNRVLDGDSAAFAEVFDEYSDWIYNVAFRRTGSWVTAEEIVSTVFLEAWRQRAAITEDDGSIRSWLLGVTLNLIRRHWRQADRQRRATLRLGSDEAYLDHSGDVAERIDAEQAMNRILESLERITDDQREVVQLWAWEELTYDEISVVLDVPVGTVKSRLHRARDALQHTLDDRHASPKSRQPDPSQAVTDRQVRGGTSL
jgi:RNA polymerase sigma-70 factor (ECF subfamily)